MAWGAGGSIKATASSAGEKSCQLIWTLALPYGRKRPETAAEAFREPKQPSGNTARNLRRKKTFNMLGATHCLHKRTRRGGRRRNRRRVASRALETGPQAWPPLSCAAKSRSEAVSYVSDSEDSVSSALTELSSSSSPTRSRASSFSSPARSRASSITSDGSSGSSWSGSIASWASGSSGASRWWHTRADTDDYDDNISWRTAFDGSDLGLNLASAARTPLISSLTVFPTDTRLVKEAAVEEDDETDGLFADVVPNLLALVDDVAKAPPAPAKAAPVAAAVVTDDDASDEEAKARAVRRARHEKRRSRNLRKLEHRAARAAQKAAAADAFDAACAEFAAAC